VKRLTLAVAAGALVFAAVAFGAATHYKGTDSDAACGTPMAGLDCIVKFNGAVTNGKVTKVKKFSYHGIPMPCDEGGAALTNGTNYPPAMSVNSHRKFSGHFHSQDNKQFVDITGRFSTNFKTAAGTLQVHGNFSSPGVPLHNCDTGVDNYSVSR